MLSSFFLFTHGCQLDGANLDPVSGLRFLYFCTVKRYNNTFISIENLFIIFYNKTRYRMGEAPFYYNII